MLRVVIIDDEALARQRLRQLLGQHPDLEIVGEAASAREALRLIQAKKPDALFLDIRLPDMDGFSLLRDLGDPPKVIFVTAHASHAVEAFDFEAVDYLLKPVRQSRLTTAIERLQSKSPGETAWQMKDKICFKIPGRTLVVAPDAIAALEADGDFTRVYMEDKPPVMICHNLSYYEKILPSPPFLRLDRSLMINRDRVTKMEVLPGNRENLTLSGVEKQFLLGRAACRRLAEALLQG